MKKAGEILTETQESSQSPLAARNQPVGASHSDASTEVEAEELHENSGFQKEWQRKLLPLMSTYFVVSSLFFFAASSWQLSSMNKYMADNGTFESTLDLEIFDINNLNEAERLNIVLLTTLEAEAMTRRYTQANVALMARVWITYLGFFTGMMLALVGSVFILGKLNTQPTRASGSYEKFKIELVSASPGLILAILGTLLITTSILVKQDIKITDGSIYTGNLLSSKPSSPSFKVDENEEN